MFYDTTPFTAANSGYRIAFRPGEQNICPGCGQSHWSIGRMTAECAFCATALPINTGGGQIGCGQPGLAGGQLNLVEAVRQLMGEGAKRQVPNPKNAMVTGIGVIPYGRNWGTSGVLILEK